MVCLLLFSYCKYMNKFSIMQNIVVKFFDIFLGAADGGGFVICRNFSTFV